MADLEEEKTHATARSAFQPLHAGPGGLGSKVHRWRPAILCGASPAAPGARAGAQALRSLLLFDHGACCRRDVASGDHVQVFQIRMNDAAASGLGVQTGRELAPVPDGLAAGLRAIIANGIVVRGQVLVWRDGARWAAAPPGTFPDLTGWECFVNSIHLEDLVPVNVMLSDDGEPSISDADQVVLLRHGLAFALELCRLAAGWENPVPVRCIVTTNRTNGTFRFHRIRAGEDLVLADLNAYQAEKVVVVDLQPPA